MHKYLISYLALLVLAMGGCTLAPPPPNLPPAGDRAVGLYPASAPLRITLFYDFGCQECGEIFTLLNELIENYEGRVILVSRDYIDKHINPGAYKASIAARCAGEQSKFDAYATMAYSYQDDWLELKDEKLIEWATQLSLDMGQFSGCYGEKRPANAIAADMADAKLLKVRKTPSVFLGKSLIDNPGSKEEWQKLLDETLGDVTRKVIED